MLPQPLILGILLFQVLYALVQWLFSKRDEYIYYASYAVILGVYFFLKYISVDGYLVIGNVQLHESFLDRQLVYFAIYVYVGFGRLFVDAPQKLPHLNKQIILARRIMLGYFFISLAWSLLSKRSSMQEIFHLLAAILTFVFFLYVLSRVYKSGYILGRLLVLGSLLMGTGVMLALVARIFVEFNKGWNVHPIIFLQIGVVLELICLNTALIYKTRSLQEERLAKMLSTDFDNSKQHFDLQSLRSEISEELQTELGEGLKDIKTMSDQVREQVSKDYSTELQRISENSERLIRSMNEIVWSLNHPNDRLDNMIRSLKDAAVQLMQQVNIECQVETPKKVPGDLVSSDARRHVFLAFKEALHNIVKHSEASLAEIRFLLIADTLQIIVDDNGKGVSEGRNSTSGGNGITNMHKRMRLLNGLLKVEPTPAGPGGTRVIFHIPLASLRIDT